MGQQLLPALVVLLCEEESREIRDFSLLIGRQRLAYTHYFFGGNTHVNYLAQSERLFNNAGLPLRSI